MGLSREYKISLKADRFSGSEAICRGAIARFWQRLAQELAEAQIGVSGKIAAELPEKQRELYFLDTGDNALVRQSGLVYRMRRRLGDGEPWKATLKFRHGDRLLTAAQSFAPKAGGEAPKIEEDVKVEPTAAGLSFRSLFSRSSDVEIGARPNLQTVADALGYYAGVKAKRLPVGQTPVRVVNDLHVIEHVFEGGRLAFRENVKAKDCAVILWWREGAPLDPIAGEFSFRLEADESTGELPPKAARDAWTALLTIASNVYADPAGKTKTALVYD